MEYKEEILYNEVGKTLEQAVRSSCGCPIAASVQGQVGRGFDPAKDVPAVVGGQTR